MRLETNDLRWFGLRWYRNMRKYDFVKYNRTVIDSKFIRVEFHRSNYYAKYECNDSMYEDIVISHNGDNQEGECFEYVDNEVPQDRLIRLTKTLKDRFNNVPDL